MKAETEEIIRSLPKDVQKSFYFGKIMEMADDIGRWDETLEWFISVRHLDELRKKSNEYEQIIEEYNE